MRTFAIPFGKYAEIAQLVEHNLAKVRVASSSLVFRSKTGHLRMTLNFANHPTGFNHMSVVLVHKGRLFCLHPESNRLLRIDHLPGDSPIHSNALTVYEITLPFAKEKAGAGYIFHAPHTS